MTPLHVPVYLNSRVLHPIVGPSALATVSVTANSLALTRNAGTRVLDHVAPMQCVVFSRILQCVLATRATLETHLLSAH